MQQGFNYRVGQLNGVAIGLAYTLVNNGLAALVAFGITINDKETSAILAFTNTGLLLVAYLAHNAAKYSRPVVPPPPETITEVKHGTNLSSS